MKSFFTFAMIFFGIISVEAKILKGKLVKGTGKGPVISAVLPPLKGPKKLVAVTAFENKVENPKSYWWRNPKLGTGMSDMLVTSLMDSDYFIVLERAALTDVLAEQDLAASGRMAKVGHAKIGKIQQSQIVIRGAVTLFEEGTKKQSKGFGGAFKGVSLGLAGGGGESQVGIDIRVIDTLTGQILAAKTCKGFATSKSRGLKVGLTGTRHGSPGALSFGGADFEKTPLADATRDAITAAVNFIVSELSKIPWAGKIIKVSENGKIYINCGERNNIHPGDQFSVFSEEEALIDPDTGENLGSEETLLGELEVVSSKEKFSIASKVSGSGFEKGNVIRFK